MRNFLGAFADGAVLFPLLALLSASAGMSSVMLLLSAGLAYWMAGLVFRVPMSVQPLKSIAVAAIAMGATAGEIRLSGFFLGFGCLLLLILGADRFASKVPTAVIHAVQFGLGILLIIQGLKVATKSEVSLLGFDPKLAAYICIAALSGFMVLKPDVRRFPVLGFVATAGLVWAVFLGDSVAPLMGTKPSNSLNELFSGVRVHMLIALLAPQLALTLANSVLGTKQVAAFYFEKSANQVTYRNLLRSIGFGNLITAAIGGLPFCHGAGGVTSHVRGGATHWIANGIIGSTLVLLAGVAWLRGGIILGYPPILISSLLVATGIFHAGLVKTTWAQSAGKVKIVLAGVVVMLTQNLLWVLASALILEVFMKMIQSLLKEQEVI